MPSSRALKFGLASQLYLLETNIFDLLPPCGKCDNYLTNKIPIVFICWLGDYFLCSTKWISPLMHWIALDCKEALMHWTSLHKARFIVFITGFIFLHMLKNCHYLVIKKKLWDIPVCNKQFPCLLNSSVIPKFTLP